MSGGENPRLTAAPIGSIFISRLRRGDGLGMLVSTHVFAATVVNAVDDRHGLRAGGVTVNSLTIWPASGGRVSEVSP